jgi:beta-lactamase regulating signal transducer with metallopeptidase domain
MALGCGVQDVLVNYLLAASAAAAVLPALAWVLVQRGRIHSPAHRHLVWSWCLVGIVVLPPLLLHAPKLRLAVLPSRPPPAPALAEAVVRGPPPAPPSRVADPLPAAPAAVVRLSAASPASSVLPWRDVLLTFWTAGTALMLLRLIAGTLHLARIRRLARPTDRCGQGEPASPGVNILLSDAVAGPVCFGLTRPTILLPRQVYRQATPGELRMILCHELAHLRRHDPWTCLGQRLLEAVLFYHPGVWLASRQLTEQRELLCDNWVLADGVPPVDYAQLLARVAEVASAPRLQAAALFEGRLLERVRALLDVRGVRAAHASRRARVITAAVALLVLGGCGLIRLTSAYRSRAATLVITVVDEQGQPVAGAKVVPSGIRVVWPDPGSAYRWDGERDTWGVPPQPVLTDAAGQARLAYPRHIRCDYEGRDTEMDTAALLLGVYHADYSATIDQSYRVDKPHGPIILRAGAVLELSGYVSSPEGVVTGVWPEISNWNVDVRETTHGDGGRRTVRGVSAGPHYVRLVHWPDQGTPRFSDPVLVQAEAHQTYTLNLELKPAMRLDGQLDDTVPRPVRNGIVQVHVSHPVVPEPKAGALQWDDWTRIAEDGSFHFEVLPHGTVQVIAVCDGFTWAIPGADRREGCSVSAMAQEFEPQGDVVRVRLKMQPAAAYEVHTVDAAGEPVAGAKISFVTFVRWYDGCGQVVDPPKSSSERVAALIKGARWPRRWLGYYEAVTDSQGVAVVHNLPAFGEPVWPSVEHPAMVVKQGSLALAREDMVPVHGGLRKVTLTLVPPAGRGWRFWRRETGG